MTDHSKCEHWDVPGYNAACEILADVPAEHRAIFSQEATYVQNMTGGRRSDALRTAVRFGLDGLTSPLAIATRDSLEAA